MVSSLGEGSFNTTYSVAFAMGSAADHEDLTSLGDPQQGLGRCARLGQV